MPPKTSDRRAAARTADGKIAQPKGETLSQYFAAENAGKHVTRHELGVILAHYHKAQTKPSAWARLKAYLAAPAGATRVTPEPDGE